MVGSKEYCSKDVLMQGNYHHRDLRICFSRTITDCSIARDVRVTTMQGTNREG